ncbi:MAG: flgL [Oscillospiraceae bacterium]|jgi:flagellar hook-associated protein 3 FlgL|nr:flgL [Oscillospiraceae bacterium]
MRITNNLLTNKFSRSLNRASFNLNTINEQVISGMKFSRASQDPSSAMKAFKIRRDLARIDQYKSNISDVQGTLEQTETTLSGIKEVLSQARESLMEGSTGTLSPTDREIMANLFSSLKDQVLKLANTSFAGKYVLGGPNTTTMPFTLDASGSLLYNGENMSNAVISTEEVYADLGQGISFDGSGNVNISTAVSISTPGSLILGYGVDGNGNSNNIYTLLSEVVTSLQTNDTVKMNQQLEKLAEKSNDVMVQITGIGERSKFVEFLSDRISADEFNLQKKQKAVEEIDQAKAITDYKSTEMAYTAALQMGSKIIQTSLLDFLR